MLDIKAWLMPYLWDMEKHTEQHHYKFTRVDGSPRTFYKNLQDHEWRIVEDSVITATPKGKPPTIRPDCSSINLDKLERQIKSMKYLFRNEKDTVKWWTDFIKMLRTNSPERRTTIKFIESLPRQPADNSNPRVSGDSSLPEEIQQMLHKETRIVDIKLKRRPTGVKQRITQKKTSTNKKKQQKSAGQRQRYMVVVFKRQVLLLSSAEEKKHIWFMILCAILLFEIGTIVCRILLLFDIFISCLQLYNGLEVLLKLMIFMWLQVLWIHMALNSVQANLGTILPDLYIHL